MKSSKSNINRHPLFVKVFQPNISSDSLLIPPEFKYKISGEIPSRVFLKSAGKTWLVEVKTVGNKSYFQGGWSKFVLGNSLSFGEFMVFKYNGQRIFNVILLGINGCDKELGTSSSGKKLVKDEVEEEEEDEDDGDGDVEEVDEVMDKVKFRKSSQQKQNYDEENDGDEEEDDDGADEDEEDDYDYDDDNDEEEEEEEEDDDDDGDEDDDEDFASKDYRKMLHKQNAREYTVKEIEQCEGLEKYIPKNNPYFVTKLRKNDHDHNRLLIPKSAPIKDFKISDNIVLQDPKGLHWDAKKSSWKNGQVWIQGGWRDLCNFNKVKEDDIVICEFLVKRNKICDCIKFHIIDANKHRQIIY